VTDPAITEQYEPSDDEKIAYLETHYNACWGCISAGAQRSCQAPTAERGEADRMRIKPDAYLSTLTANTDSRARIAPTSHRARSRWRLLEAFWRRRASNPSSSTKIAGLHRRLRIPQGQARR
jgi:hypothetical protein